MRRERWSLSWKGWLAAVALCVVAAVAFLRGVYPFLLVSDGGNGDVMVVEGWIGGRKVDRAAEAYRLGHYQRVLVVRDVFDAADKWSSGRYSVDYIANDLAKLGVPTNVIHKLYCPVTSQDRTYHCALAVKSWLATNQVSPKQLDVVTIGCHSRRSRLLYAKAFDGQCDVATIPLIDQSFDSAHWWRSSEGVREVPFEFVAYIYARFFFSPGNDESEH